MSSHYDVIVIGGGASGMMAAGAAAGRGRRVLVIEKNSRLGAKLSITGGGRCNVTNSEFDVHALLTNYGVAKDFLYTPFSQFGIEDTIRFFESRGLPLFIEDRKRTFPVSQKAVDVVRVMEQYATEGSVAVRLNTRVREILTDLGSVAGVATDAGMFTADSYVLATGGMSHPETGSTGDGFEFLRVLGHTVHKPTPTIVPLTVYESWVSSLAGATVPDAKVHFYVDGKKQFTKRGSLLFTHVGVSGPVILNSAYKVADMLHAGEVTAAIDMYPDLDFIEIEQRILSIFDNNKNKTFKNVIKEVMSTGNADVWRDVFTALNMSTNVLNVKVHSVSREDRRAIARLVKALPLTIQGLMGFDKAVLADGGVLLSEVDTRTMCSKVLSNLFITGDLLHINRPSGGYSLQLCWTTGFVAGSHC